MKLKIIFGTLVVVMVAGCGGGGGKQGRCEALYDRVNELAAKAKKMSGKSIPQQDKKAFLTKCLKEDDDKIKKMESGMVKAEESIKKMEALMKNMPKPK